MKLTNQALLLIGVAVMAITVLLATLILSNGNFYIKNLGTSLEQNGVLVNTISVAGDGEAFSRPDMAYFDISFSELDSTSSEALRKANEKLNNAVNVLKSNNIEDSNIQTNVFSVSPEYDWNNGRSNIIGQRATVGVSVKVKGLDTEASLLTKLVDEISKLDGVQLGAISFDIENKTALFTEARKLAFNKAKQKAEELASLSNVKLLTPVSISDTTYDINPPSPVYKNVAFAESAPMDSGSSTISTGELKISINLSVVWGIE